MATINSASATMKIISYDFDKSLPSVMTTETHGIIFFTPNYFQILVHLTKIVSGKALALQGRDESEHGLRKNFENFSNFLDFSEKLMYNIFIALSYVL